MTRNRIGDASEDSIFVGSVEAPDSNYVLFVEIMARNDNDGWDSARMFLDEGDVESLKKAIQGAEQDNE